MSVFFSPSKSFLSDGLAHNYPPLDNICAFKCPLRELKDLKCGRMEGLIAIYLTIENKGGIIKAANLCWRKSNISCYASLYLFN